MQISIRYTEKFGLCAGGIETLNTPLESDFDKWRMHFACLKHNKHWALVLSRNTVIKNKDKQAKVDWGYEMRYCILLESDTRCTRAEYLEWLNTYVKSIEVDGKTFWINEKLLDAMEGDNYEY